MKTLLRLVVLTLTVTMAAGCGMWGGKPNADNNNRGGQSANADGKPFGKPEKPKFKIPVTVQTLQRGRMYSYLQAVGTVVPIKEVEIKSEMTGRIYFTKKWKEGDEVKTGDAIASIDDRELRLNINQAELDLQLAKNALGPAKAKLDQAKKDEEFNQAMLTRGAISKADFDKAVLARIQEENNYEQTKSNIEARQMALTKLQQELEKVTINAPFAGVLLPPSGSVSTSASAANNETDLTQAQGTLVGSNSVVCRLANIDQVYVSLDVPAKDLLDINVGQKVELDVYSRVGREYIGSVSDISTTLNSNTRTYTVNVHVDNPEHELRPGMFAKARIITKEKLDAISIPRELVLLRNNRNVVFVATPKVEDATAQAEPEAAERRQLALAGDLDALDSAGDPASASGEEMSEAEKALMGEEEGAEPAPREDKTEWVVEERVVELGIENRERVEVVDGLRAGDKLVVLGYETLSDGVDVNVTERPTDPEEIFSSKEN
ncbi:MAG: efflux RND transporter periplasmic adaptor subunit [bacterium]|nr:efflux RND transporter periplasmic adaptor subunit [bacterium]